MVSFMKRAAAVTGVIRDVPDGNGIECGRWHNKVNHELKMLRDALAHDDCSQVSSFVAWSECGAKRTEWMITRDILL